MMKQIFGQSIFALAFGIYCAAILASQVWVRGEVEVTKTSLPTTRATNTHLDLEVTQLAASAVAGDRIMLRAIVRNNGAAVIRFAASPNGRNGFSFTIKDQSNKPVGETTWGRSFLQEAREGSIMALTVKPGETISTELNLSRCFDLSREGVYFVEVGFPFGATPISGVLRITVERPDR